MVSKDSVGRQAVADVVMDRFGEEPQALDYTPTHLLVDFETLSGVYVSPCSIQEVAYHAPVNLKHVRSSIFNPILSGCEEDFDAWSKFHDWRL